MKIFIYADGQATLNEIINSMNNHQATYIIGLDESNPIKDQLHYIKAEIISLNKINADMIISKFNPDKIIVIRPIIMKYDIVYIINIRNYINGLYKFIANNYHNDIMNIFIKIPFDKTNQYVLIKCGDNTNNHCACFAKVKKTTDNETMCILLDTLRHFDMIPLALSIKVPFINKKPIAVWRGVTTNNLDISKNLRYNLVSKWYDITKNKNIDVGFTQFVQGHKEELKYIKKNLTIQEMCQYKYIIMIEGNDVATGLKWALASNSVVLMPPPTFETVFEEGKLVPYEHYIPILPDTSDLKIQIEYCEKNGELCNRIITNANKYCKIFIEGDWKNTLVDYSVKKILDFTNKDESIIINNYDKMIMILYKILLNRYPDTSVNNIFSHKPYKFAVEYNNILNSQEFKNSENSKNKYSNHNNNIIQIDNRTNNNNSNKLTTINDNMIEYNSDRNEIIIKLIDILKREKKNDDKNNIINKYVQLCKENNILPTKLLFVNGYFYILSYKPLEETDRLNIFELEYDTYMNNCYNIYNGISIN